MRSRPSRLKFLLPAAAMLGFGAAHADTLTASDRIQSATVYHDRAVVSRVADIALPVGEHEVVFDGLPLNLIDDSLQVTGLGAGVTLLDVGHKRVTNPVAAQPRAAELQKQIDELSARDRELHGRVQANERSLELLRDIEATWVSAPRERPAADAANARPAALPSLEEYQKLISFGEENRIKTLAARQALDKQREELARTVADKKRELKELGVKNPLERTVEQVVLRVAVVAPVTARLNLSYGVAGATWSPAYDARLATADRAVQLNYFGVVKNGTGEDWTGVALKLSTARPNIAAQVPVPVGIKLHEVRPVYPQAQQMAYSDKSFRVASSSLSKSGGRAPEAAEVVAGFVADKDDRPAVVAAQASVAETGTSATFTITTAVNLPNDNTPHRVSIGEVKLPADLRYELVPASSEFAYLTGKVRNTTELPFLRGPVAVFIDGTYVSASRFDTTVPQDAFTLSFGIDEGIAIKRKPLNKFTEDTGMTGKYDRTTYTWQTTVTNNKRTKETLVLKEVLPLSENEEIEVKALTPDADAMSRTDLKAKYHLDEQGIVTSTLTFEPGQKQELTFAYRVDRPKKMPINAPTN